MSKTGRHSVTTKSGRKFVVEPITKKPSEDWGHSQGDGDMESLDHKYRGAVRPEESVVTEENGFKNIVDIPPGVSPLAYIEKLEDDVF